VTKQLTDEAMKVTLAGSDSGTGHRTVHKITKQMPVADAHGEYIGATLIGTGVASDLAAALDETWRRVRTCTTRTATRCSPTRACRSVSRVAIAGVGRGRRSRDLDRARRSHAAASPYDLDATHHEVSPGALGRLDTVIADSRISTGGRVAVVHGSGIGPSLAGTVAKMLPAADLITIEAGTFDSAMALATQLRTLEYDAVIGIGGRKSHRHGQVRGDDAGHADVAVATSLAHDGLASPVSTLVWGSGSPSYGVHIPIAVVVDLDLVARSPAYQIKSGIGDALSDISACADWELSHAINGEPVDGLAMSLARTAAEIGAAPSRHDYRHRLSGHARAIAHSGRCRHGRGGSSRPCSGACHEIAHALATLQPDAASHGIGAGLGALFAMFLRSREDESFTPSFERLMATFDRPRTSAHPGRDRPDRQGVRRRCGRSRRRPDRAGTRSSNASTWTRPVSPSPSRSMSMRSGDSR